MKCMQTNPDSLPVEKTGKSHLLKRFPDHWAAVIALFEENEAFRSLCNEYCLALDASLRIDGIADARARNTPDRE